MCFDSSSQSDASQTSTTQNTDMRVAGGEGSLNVSSQNSTLEVNVTDGGAVEAAFGFADRTLKGALDVIKTNDAAASEEVRAALESVADAWETAKAGEQKVLVGMGLLVVGIVAVQSFKKG